MPCQCCRMWLWQLFIKEFWGLVSGSLARNDCLLPPLRVRFQSRTNKNARQAGVGVIPVLWQIGAALLFLTSPCIIIGHGRLVVTAGDASSWGLQRISWATEAKATRWLVPVSDGNRWGFQEAVSCCSSVCHVHCLRFLAEFLFCNSRLSARYRAARDSFTF